MAINNVTATSQQFTIQEPQSIVLNAPNSGSFQHTQNITIQWTKTNFTDNVDLYYTTSTTFSTSNNIVTNYNTHPYVWNVPSSLSGSSIYIWVRKVNDSNVKDRSNNAISITGATISRTLAEVINKSDTPTKTTGIWKHVRTLAETLTSSDTDSKVSRTWSFIRTIAEGMTASDTSSKQTRQWKKIRSLAEVLNPSDTDSKATRNWIKIRTLAEGLVMSDSDSKVSRLWKKFKTFAETLASSDTDSSVARVWLFSRTIEEGLGTSDTDSDGHLRLINEEMSVTDTWVKSIQKSGNVYELNAGGTDEAFQAIYRTGWIMPNNLSNNTIIRRVNLDYLSDSDVTLKIFKDDDYSTPFATKILPSSQTATHDSIRLATRVKYFLISIETTQSSNENVRIEKIEIEVDD
tara:strand:+ start:47 stop:1261 length:1215 start_codon:yes stop_codon:yes gene_type:complete